MTITDAISNYITEFASQAVEHPVIATATCAVLALSALGLCLARKRTNIGRIPQLQMSPRTTQPIIHKLAQEIMDLKPTIGDAASYEFVKTHKQFVNEHNTKAGSLSMLAAAMRASAKQEKYGKSAEEILRLGQDLLKTRSGQCDHMAAAFIAKVVEHIRAGGEWNYDVELMGNGGHAFIAINRDDTIPTNDPKSWKNATMVDTWLGCLGVNDKYKKQLPDCSTGVIENAKKFAAFFGAEKGRIQTTHKFTAKDLHALALGST